MGFGHLKQGSATPGDDAETQPAGAWRYALYYAPAAESALWRFGCDILGYDAECGADLTCAGPGGLEPDLWREMCRKPAGYGFHGTLKAPFRLAPGHDEAVLVDAVAALAASCQPFQLPALELRPLGDFFALVPSAPVPEMCTLARRAVLELDRFRAPLTEEDRIRRNVERLTPRQRVLLEAHGYPFVLEEFRFHMTLTGPVGEELRADVQQALVRAYAESRACAPLPVQDICLFSQQAPHQRFRLLQRFTLADAACMVA